LEATLAHQRKQVLKLETQLASGESCDCSELSPQLKEAHGHLASLEKDMCQKRAALGVDDQVDLQQLQQDVFLCICMDALALKECVRDRLLQWKFEIEKLE